MNKIYTGIGSRDTPEGILTLMRETASKLSTLGFTLRSGGASGGDSAFREGFEDAFMESCMDGEEDSLFSCETYLPCAGFNSGIPHFDVFDIILSPPEMRAAQLLASKHHPRWRVCNDSTRRLHGRNSCQVLGINLDIPTDFVLYYAPVDLFTGEVKGGTATAVNIAKYLGIPTINMLFDSWEDELAEFVNL